MAINLVLAPNAAHTGPDNLSEIIAQLGAIVNDKERPVRVAGSNVVKGAFFNIGGALFVADADTAISGTPSEYVKLTVSGTTATPSFVANLTGVTWNSTYKGYYDGSGNLHVFDEYRWQGKIVRITSGSGNWVVPFGVSRIRVTCIGGGGGGGEGYNGSGGSANGAAGTQTTFAGATTGAGGSGGIGGGANGLGGAGAVGAGAADGATGSTAQNSCGGSGGGAGGSGGSANVAGRNAPGYGGGGGGGGGSGTNSKSGGGGGGTNISNVLGDILTVVPGQSIAYSVGPGGAGGTGNAGADGGAGGSGIIIIEY